jgi:AcrR family transcriptional regulator
MPRPFTPAEHDALRDRLLTEAAARFAALGFERTSVAEIAAAVGIAKGSFYLFFPSKEAALFAAHEVASARAREALLAAVAPLEAAGDGRAALTALLRGSAQVLTDHPLLRRLAEPATMARLLRALPPDAQRRHRAHDRAWSDALQRRWSDAGLLHPDAPDHLLHHLSAGVLALVLGAEVLDDGVPIALTTFAEGAGARWGRG